MQKPHWLFVCVLYSESPVRAVSSTVVYTIHSDIVSFSIIVYALLYMVIAHSFSMHVLHVVSHFAEDSKYFHYTGAHQNNQVKSDKIDSSNKDDQRTRNYVSLSTKQGESREPKEKVTDTSLYLDTRERKEYLHRELLFEGEYNMTGVCMEHTCMCSKICLLVSQGKWPNREVVS